MATLFGLEKAGGGVLGPREVRYVRQGAVSPLHAPHAGIIRVRNQRGAGPAGELGPSDSFRPVATPLDGLIEHPLEGTHRHANTSPYTDRGYVPALGRLIRPSAGQVEVPLTGFRDTNR